MGSNENEWGSLQAQAELQGLQAAVQQHLPQEQTVRIRRLEALHAMLSLDTVSEVLSVLPASSRPPPPPPSPLLPPPLLLLTLAQRQTPAHPPF